MVCSAGVPEITGGKSSGIIILVTVWCMFDSSEYLL
jgi:hypothetical protein